MKAMDLPDNGKAVQMNDRYEELLSTHADLLTFCVTITFLLLPVI